jgi:hypothetical protein
MPLICRYGNHCEINENNRRNCSCCRLAKCFSNGMSTDLIRSSRTTQIKKNKSTNLIRLSQINQHQQVLFSYSYLNIFFCCC